MKKSHLKNTEKKQNNLLLAVSMLVLITLVIVVALKLSAPGGEAVTTDTSISLSSYVSETSSENSFVSTTVESGESTEPETEEEQFSPEDFNGYLGNDPELQEHPKAPRRVWVENLEIPEFSEEAYILLNDGKPFFDTANIEPTCWEIYYDLDELGRCTLAEGVFGTETMPTEKRGSISAIKPTGWHSDKYPKELVNGESLYNRCHLVAFGLSGETANKYNLVTGTRYFNTDGINAFENMMIDYIRETNNHIRYRVTPVFTGENLVCDGQVVEAWSVEDGGEGICFCIWSYNVQPGVYIDYLTGDNHLEGEPGLDVTNPNESDDSKYLLAEDISGDFILNKRSKKIHIEDCEGVDSMSEKNKEKYSGSYNELIRQGYEPDYFCLGNMY